ncbi:MAG: hypothetical protein JWP69_990 [Flaviaesturariibacter sp.]|nr:hypothetical protein [Flaviaesturariibacter sp.]
MKHFIVCLTVLAMSCHSVTDTDPTEPVTVTAPETKPTQVDPMDLSYLRIKLGEGGYAVSISEELLITKELNALDSFLSANKARIDTNKVVMVGKNIPERVKDIQPLLVKHGISKFQVNED